MALVSSPVAARALMLSGGGITAPQTARRFPVRLIESGPVGGGLAMAWLCERAGIGDAVMFDMGGTTAKMCVVRGGHLLIADEYEVEDGPDDEGEMFMRPAKAADYFVPPFANEQAARASNNGALPPDLSLIVKARKDGANYLYGLLTGYEEEAPEGVEMMEGMYYNEYFPGHQIAMAPPLAEGSVDYADGTEATLDQEAHDVVTFLAWAAQPELEERKRLGVKVLLFLIVLTGMLYAVKRKIWSDVH